MNILQFVVDSFQVTQDGPTGISLGHDAKVGIVGAVHIINPQFTMSHMCLVGFCPSHASFIVRSFCSHLHENSSLLGTNVIIPSQNFKYSS